MQTEHHVDVCIAGGGPAGLTLALLLARKGIRTLVLEHNEDFSREFRGEVLMPRFLQAFEQIGFDRIIANEPQQRLDRIFLDWRDRPVASIRLADVSRTHPYALWMPQPAMLGALDAHGRTLPGYDLWFRASARDIVRDERGAAIGVHVKRGGEHVTVRARIIVAADGRYSRLRKDAGIDLEIDVHDFDVLWFDLPRPLGQDATFRAWLTPRRNYLLLPKYPDRFQCGMFTEPAGLANYRAAGLETLRADLLGGPAAFHEFARGLTDFSRFHPLEARIALARTWAQDGFLMIGDAAHTCSPAGAIGVAVAVETAIVAAPVIVRALAASTPTREALGEVERLRKAEVRDILVRQRRIGRFIATPAGWRRPFLLMGARVLARSGILPRALRSLVTRSTPLPVHQ